MWCRQERILLPALGDAATGGRIIWRLPVYPTVHHMLTNPVYAGAYAFGRRTARVTIENGRKRVVRSMQRDWRNWEVLIRDHHEGYISWAEFEGNQQLIADNANGKRFMSRGAVRPGEATARPLPLRPVRQEASRPLWPDLSLRVCGRLQSTRSGWCITFGGMRVDRVLAKEVLARLQPLGVKAALAASKRAASSAPRGKISSSWPSSKLATRPPGYSASMMPPTRRTGWWPASWSGDGTSAWPRCAILSSRSSGSTPTRRRP